MKQYNIYDSRRALQFVSFLFLYILFCFSEMLIIRWFNMRKVGQIFGFASHYTAFPHSNERRVCRERWMHDRLKPW